MIPGPYSICAVEVPEDTDSPNYYTLRWGYDSIEDARADMPKIAKEEGYPIADLCVLRSWGKDESIDEK